MKEAQVCSSSTWMGVTAIRRHVYPLKSIYAWITRVPPIERDFNFSILLNSIALEHEEAVNINSVIKSSEWEL